MCGSVKSSGWMGKDGCEWMDRNGWMLMDGWMDGRTVTSLGLLLIFSMKISILLCEK
jgi:hypothetical protein